VWFSLFPACEFYMRSRRPFLVCVLVLACLPKCRARDKIKRILIDGLVASEVCNFPSSP